ncbi:heme ABC transporter ATP-binding protein [Clostridium sp. JNZ J1-5]
MDFYKDVTCKNNVISLKNLNFSYNNEQILEDIKLNIEKGKFYSILGPNGSGKTTLIKNISRVFNVENKSIFIEEKDIKQMSNKELSKKLAVVPQHSNIDFDFSVMDIVLMGRAPYISRFSTESEKDIELTKKAMEMTNVWHLRSKSINSISGGERQRVMIARAICQNTNIMLLDEPISNLDIYHQIDILNTLKKLNIDNNITIVAILHDLNLASTYSDYMVLMKDGKIYCKGKSEEVLTKEIIKQVYEIDVQVMTNPVTGKPHIIPLI